MIVNADEGAGEGENLTECNEDGVVYLTQRWATEARDEQHTAKYAQTDR